MGVLAIAKSDVGRVREHNEDAFLMDDAHCVYAVADGMGGHAGGEHASALAVSTLQSHLQSAGAILLDDALAALELAALTQSSHSGAPIDVLADAAQVPGSEALLRADIDASAVPDPANEAGHDGADAAALSIPYVVYDVWDPGIERASVAPVINRMLADGVRRACRAIYDAAAEQPELLGMGTTTTVLCVHQKWAYVAHVGDSRCYMLRGNQLMQVTEDHSLVNEQIKAGLITAEDARVSRHKNIITRSVGFEPEVEVDSFMLPVQPGDHFLLCSDGLSNLVEDEDLVESMTQLRGHSLVNFLVDLALERGGDDNITVITVDILDETHAAPQ